MLDTFALSHSFDNIVSSEPCSPIQLRRARSLEPANGSKPRSPPRSPSSPPTNSCIATSFSPSPAPYYAGGAYNNSPPPSSLPAPEFTKSSSPPYSPCTSPVKSHSQPPLVEGLSPKCLGSPQPVYSQQPRVLQFDQAYLPPAFSMTPPGGDLAVLSLELRQLLRIAG